MRKDKGPKEKPCETSACINFQLEDSQLRQLFVVSYGEMSQLNQDYYQLFHSALVSTEDLHAKLCQMPLISLRRHHKLLVKD